MKKGVEKNGAEEIIDSATSSEYYDKQPDLLQRGTSKLRRQWNQAKVYFLVVAASLLFYFALLRLTGLSGVAEDAMNVLMPIIFGIAIAYLLNPLVGFIEKHLFRLLYKKANSSEKAVKLMRGIAIGISISVLLAIILGLFSMVIPELYTSLRKLIYSLPRQMNELVDRINQIEFDNSTEGLLMKNMLTEIVNTAETWIKTDLLKQVNIIMTGLTEGIINILTVSFNFIIGLVVAVYLLFGKEAYLAQGKKVIYAAVKPDKANMVLHLARKSNEIFGGFIIGKLLDALVVGVLCFIGLWILKSPYALLVSVVVGVTNIIPFFGPYIGAVPSAILILLADPRKGIYFIILIFLIQQLDGNVIEPKILENSIGLSAFWVIFSILLGGGMFGFIGMIMGVPTFAVIYYIVQMLINQKLAKKKLPIHSCYYDEMSYVDIDGNYVSSDKKKEEFENADSSAK